MKKPMVTPEGYEDASLDAFMGITGEEDMENKKVAKELIKIAKSITGAIPDNKKKELGEWMNSVEKKAKDMKKRLGKATHLYDNDYKKALKDFKKVIEMLGMIDMKIN